MARRYGVQLSHARKVADLAHRLFQSLQPLHRLPPALGKLLEAAAYLHDIGHFVSDTSHHKHSYYLVAHSDLPGFTDTERQMIALLCRYHRKSMPTPRHSPFQTIDPESRRAINHAGSSAAHRGQSGSQPRAARRPISRYSFVTDP